MQRRLVATITTESHLDDLLQRDRVDLHDRCSLLDVAEDNVEVLVKCLLPHTQNAVSENTQQRAPPYMKLAAQLAVTT